MVQDKSVEQLENSAVKLTITVGKDAVASEYEQLVGKYEKTAQIKGFRKGKVPRPILERKFGDAFRFETLQKVMDESLREALEDVDKRPLPYSQPELKEEVDLELGKDLTFAVQYDVYPDFSVPEYTGITVSEPQVKITKEDEDRELENLRQQNALVMERDADPVESGDIVTLDIVELDESDNPVEGTDQQDVSITVGDKTNYYQIDDEIIGLAVNDQKTIEKTYPEDFSVDELAGSTKRLGVTVKTVKYRDIPELDDEFAQDVNETFETLDDLRKDVRQRLEKNRDQRLRSEKINQILEHLGEQTEIPLPESMVHAELHSAWNNFANQYRLEEEQLEQLLKMQGKDKEELFQEWRPEAEKRLKRNLIIQKLIEKEEISTTEAEAENHLREQAADRPGSVDQVVEYYRNNGMIPYVQQELAEERLYDKLLESATVKKGKKTDYMDLVNQNR